MSGPYGSDVGFSLMLGGCLLLFLIVACVIEVYLDARQDKR